VEVKLKWGTQWMGSSPLSILRCKCSRRNVATCGVIVADYRNAGAAVAAAALSGDGKKRRSYRTPAGSVVDVDSASM